jgi:hypothetical protein
MLRLFLSVDMAGSTEFKARFTGQGSDGWLAIFRSFFTSFPLMVAGQVGREFFDEPETPSIAVWKVMGDEVLFVTTPQTSEEVTSTLIALLRALRLYEAKHFSDTPLRLKATAWFGDFSGPNIEVEVPELDTGQGRYIDYIGPDIDLGFRVTKFARPGVMALSLDVLEVMLAGANADKAAIYLMGAEALKGVMFGRPYPIVWMRDAEHPFDFLPWEVEQDPLIRAATTAEPASVADLTRAIGDMRLYLRRVHGRDRPPPKLGGAGEAP